MLNKYNNGLGFDIVLADPPWQYSTCGTAKLPYKSMTIEDLMSFPLDRLMAKRCLVFVWLTCPLLMGQQADITTEWRRRYKLHFKGTPVIWVKTTKAGVPLKATGPRPNTVKPVVEFLVCFGTHKTGRVLPIMTEKMEQVVLAPRGKHSAKPPIFRDRIDELFGPKPSRIELFARGTLPAPWAGWGDQHTGPKVLPDVL